MTVVVRMVVMLAVWLALWGRFSAANVLSGLVVSAAVVLLVDPGRRGAVVVRPLAVAHFTLYFLYKLVVSTVVVARTIVAPRERVYTGIVAVPLVGCSEALATVVAHAISLTPGTLTMDVGHNPLTLYVHALDVREVEQLEADVRRLEVLAVRAFGSTEAMEGLAVSGLRSWRRR